MADAFSEFVQRWTTPPLSYLLLAVLIVIGCIIVFKYFYKPKKSIFKGETNEYVVKELNLKKQFKEFSRKCKKGKIYHNVGTVKIRRMMYANVKIEKISGENVKIVTSNVSDKMKFILFKAGSFWSEIPIISFFSKPEFFIINNDEKFITKDDVSDTWLVKPEVYFYRFAEVWICSVETNYLVSEMIYKRTHENAKEEDMNYIKRVVCYNNDDAYRMAKAHIDHELEKDKYSSRVQNETGTGSK
jgi:hypothetical protein